ncbi:MAG TPA: carbohydrate binding domain-containing protein [Chitinophagaceae bacterium]|jgi:YD repeat-containing protein|nr:carbohydrate binding domain-containing protein [Chitinophagaceae bacterium]
MKRGAIFAAILFLSGNFFFYRSIAQQTSTIIPPSPDASALGVYGNIPVSTYTGVPFISIPLYTVSYRDIQIPIELSYHGSGVTVEQDASWVGLGWTMNVGGVVTRTMRHGDDMQTCNDGFSTLGTYYSKGYPFDNQNEASGTWENDICNGSIDPEPDIFYFNFLGKSGSFILESGQSLSANFIQATPLNAEKIEIKYDKANQKWQIRTSNGYVFYFGTKEITETVPGGAHYGEGPESVQFPSSAQLAEIALAADNTIVSAWYLDKIVTPLGEEVNYIYDSKVPNVSQSNYLYGSARISITEVKQNLLIDPGSQGSCYAPPSQTTAAKTFTFHVYLKEISHPLGKIIFNKSLRDDMIPATTLTSNLPYLIQGPAFFMNWSQYGPQKLDNIIVQDNTGATIKKFELSYTYFNAQFTGEDRYNYKRLKLEKVRECSQQDCKPYYQLFYNESYALPSKYSKAQDFWGYYNGASNNTSRIPYGTYYYNNTYYSLGESDRQPNSLFMTSGTLNKIIYPTGGSTEFEFEPHDYYYFSSDAFALTDFVNNSPVPTGMPPRVVPQNASGVYAKTAGGLRIKRIITKESAAATPQIKRYDYTVVQNGEKYSTGSLLLDPRYHVPAYCDVSSPGLLVSIMGRSWINSPLGTSGSGSIVGYDRVTEINGENGENGRTEYYYINQIEEATGFPTQIEGYPTVKRTSNGLLQDLKHFNSSGTILSSENYEYTKQLTKDIKGTATQHMLHRTYSYQGNIFVTTCYPQAMATQPYTIVSDRWACTKKTDRLYAQNSGDFIQTITDYEFDTQTHLQLKSEQSTSSNGDLIKATYLYPPDAAWIPTAMWQDKFIYDKIVEKKTFRNNNLTSTYKAFFNSGANTFLLDREEASVYSNTPELLRTYSYSTNGNVQEITGRDGVAQSYIWGYNKTYPIANAINAKSNEIFFNDFEQNGWDGSGLDAYDNSKKHTGKYSGRIDNAGPGEKVVHANDWLTFLLTHPTKFKYSGWVYSTGPSAEIFLFMKTATEQNYYTYVSSVTAYETNKWVYIEGEYTVPTNITRLNIRIDNNGAGTVWFDDIKLHPSNAEMITYTYDPLIGMTSQTDVNNRVLYYEYDGFGRLSLIRDENKSILKKFCYNYKGQQENCTVNTTPLWQSTGNYRCVIDGSGNNTGYQEREERDNNPNSATNNQLRWVDNGYNTSACPLPCDYSICAAQGEGYACINGQCEYGYRVNTGSYYDYGTGMYECVYHYEFSDGSWSQDYSEYSYYPCPY